jgi:gliding motility-associated-like protein
MIKTKINNQYAKKVLTFLAIVLFGLSSKAQVNLIPNPSFESNTGIPQNFSEINKCDDWYDGFGTVDYYSSISTITYQVGNCSMNTFNNWTGNQVPKSGNRYIGIYLRTLLPKYGYPKYSNYFELVGTKLNSKLNQSHIYDFTLNYSLSEGSGILNNQLSAYFSQNQFTLSYSGFNPNSQSWYSNNINNINPQVNNDTTQLLNQDSLNWIPFNGCFIANGNEEYVTIGNFRDGSYNKIIQINNTFSYPCPGSTNPDYCYLYIDDVSLYDRGYYSGKVKTKRDTTICFNTPYVIGSNLKDSATYVWQPVAGLSCTNCPNPIANPSVTTKYTVTKTLCSYITKDSVTITVYTPTATAKAGNDYTICANQNKILELGTSDSTSFAFYNWLPSINLTCTNCATPICVPTSDITYVLQRTECNITTTSSVTITLEDCETTYTIPNIFTPNNDNVNDVWGITFNQIRYVKGFYVRVYNRWGTLLFESDKPNQKWDAHTTSGEAVSDGIYFYTLEFTVNDKPINLKGSITLIR